MKGTSLSDFTQKMKMAHRGDVFRMYRSEELCCIFMILNNVEIRLLYCIIYRYRDNIDYRMLYTVLT